MINPYLWAVAAKGTIVQVNTGYMNVQLRLEAIKHDEDQRPVYVTPSNSFLNKVEYALTGALLLTTSQLYPLLKPAVKGVLDGAPEPEEVMRALAGVDAEIWWLTDKGPVWGVDKEGATWKSMHRGQRWAFLGPVPEVVRQAVEHGCRLKPSTSLLEILHGLEDLGLLSPHHSKITTIGNYEEKQ